jgi:hypothetical protein
MGHLVERYLLLGLRLGRHIDGFVDAYYGPPELSSQVEAEGEPDPAALAEEAAALGRELAGADGFEDQRRHWLLGQIRGCETVARRLAGEQLSWAEEVERCYGVRPEVTPDDRFAEAQEELERALPGEGDLGERYRAWLETQVVPRERILPAVERLAGELQARTERLFGLPDGEHVELDVVENEPWGAFNYYLGDLRSRVVINTDLPVYSMRLALLVAHEIYPGHHTEHAWKEQLLVRDRGTVEESIFLTGTPQAVVSEGIAMLAPEIALAGEEDDVVEPALSELGIPYDAPTARAARDFAEALEGLGVNLAYQLHEEGRARDDVIAYGVRWSLRTPEHVAKVLEFVTHPTWRAYASCYTSGLELCRRFTEGDPLRFRQLLTEQLTPADLEASAPVKKS